MSRTPASVLDSRSYERIDFTVKALWASTPCSTLRGCTARPDRRIRTAVSSSDRLALEIAHSPITCSARRASLSTRLCSRDTLPSTSPLASPTSTCLPSAHSCARSAAALCRALCGQTSQLTPASLLALQRSEELPISHLDLDTLGAFGDFEAFKVRRGLGFGATRLCWRRVCGWVDWDWVRARTTRPLRRRK